MDKGGKAVEGLDKDGKAVEKMDKGGKVVAGAEKGGKTFEDGDAKDSKNDKASKVAKSGKDGKKTKVHGDRSRSVRAGVHFPVGRLHRYLKKYIAAKSRVGGTAGVFLAA